MKCYVTCLSIPADYINVLAKNQPNHITRLSVERSKLFDMSNPKDRIQLAKIITQLVVQGYAAYNRFKSRQGKALVDRLLN